MEMDFYCGHHAVTDTNEGVETFIHDHLNLPNFKSTSIFLVEANLRVLIALFNFVRHHLDHHWV
jgi:hypothetical protein